MEVTFGKHQGKSIETLVIKEPTYTAWMLLVESPTGQMKSVQKRARQLVSCFDDKPIIIECYGKGCGNRATRCTIYLNNVATPHWWCDECDPYQSGANPGKLQAVQTYQQALGHVDMYCKGRVTDARNLVRSLAQAKGLPARITEGNAKKFLSKYSQ